MKKLILILTTAIVVSSCDCGGDYKYFIRDNYGNRYYCNFYNENEDGCIMFNDRPGTNKTTGMPTIICGDYTIRKLK